MRVLVMVRGTNFEGKFDGKTLGVGFYATRGLEAATVGAIDQEMLFRSIVSELESKGINTTPKSRMWISECVQRIDSDSRNFGGFSFYPESGWLRRIFSKLFD